MTSAKAKPRKKAVAKVSRARTPPFVNHPDWSTAKFWSYVRSGLRSTYNKWPPKWNILAKAKRAYEGEGKQQKWEYLCAVCKQHHKQKDISVDHIEPCGSLNSFEDLPGFVERLFVHEEGLRVLCNDCHKVVTAAQRVEKTK